MRSDDFDALSRRILDSVVDDDRVLGLVMLGSTSDARRRDEWSDHDFFLITRAGEQESFRRDLRWVADDEDVAGSVRETEHGVQVVLRDGHLLEFAVFDLDEIALARVNARTVLLDRADVTARLDAVATAPTRRPVAEATTLFLSHVGTAIARHRRGEEVAARVRLAGVALPLLIDAALAQRGVDPPDPLDLTRRLESAAPDLAADLVDAFALADLDSTAQRLLTLAEDELGHRGDFPWGVDDAVRRRLGYDAVPQDRRPTQQALHGPPASAGPADGRRP